MLPRLFKWICRNRVALAVALLTVASPVSVKFVLANGGDPGLVYYISTDHLNTPRVITNGAGQAVWRWDNTEPFGASVPNENPSGLGIFTCNLRLPGQYFDKETNLHYNYFRDYDPATGRYPQSDPIGLRGGLNTYAYVGSNPISFADPLGLDSPGLYAMLSRMSSTPIPPSPLPYSTSFGPSQQNCAQYPEGLLRNICTGTPNSPNMNCARKCLQQTYPGNWQGPRQDYAFWAVPQHPICWFECNLGPSEYCSIVSSAAGGGQ